MTADHMADRLVRAERIIQDVANYKICEGCDSIVATRVDLCPNCHSYHFNEQPDDVAVQARTLASRPQTTVTAEDLE